MSVVALAVALTLGVSSQVSAQESTASEAPQLDIKTATHDLEWNEAAEPTRVIGPIYFVGTRGLSSWLITTSEGLILLNTGTQVSGPMIETSIRAMGFKPEDIKLLLTGHAHFDHVGGHAHIKKISRTEVAMMDAEAELLDSGGRSDFHYGRRPEFAFDPVKTDRMLKDGDTVKLGEVTLTARLTAGHTKGSTTWITSVVEGGKHFTVVFPDGTGINPGYRVAKYPSYPGIGDDYRRTLRTLESLKPDVWLTPHTQAFDFEGKRARANRQGATAWVDPGGYRKWVARQRENFEATVRKEMGTPAKGR